ncbi:uncharacterized protein LOC124910753 [Impatiens glandulifera]|uniref:uncharacterized protein LOC124910753 n=1 Tax=Impatiens glandulifera TaxID=253017 RepID=UPI001FB0E31D|nr:uncharacterized protein LOC124910753 [Impatiens glandulifera]
MSEFNVRSWPVLVMLVVLIVVGGWEVKVCGATGPSPGQCRRQRRMTITACKPVVYGKAPSAYCCHRVRVTHVDCVCPEISPKLAELIDVDKFVHLIEGCGRKVPHNYKCGSIITP